MKKGRKRGAPRPRRAGRAGRALLRLGALLAVALGLGMAWSAGNTGKYLPTLAGNAYSMLAGEDALYMVLSNENNNCLVRADYDGELLNYSATPASRAYQDMDVSGETVYAIVNDYVAREDFCGNVQFLAALSLKHASMRPKRLLTLEGLEGAPAGVFWREVYPPAPGEACVRAAGIDGDGQGYLLRYEPGTGEAAVEKVLEGETLFALKYVSEGRLVWIGRDGRAGQEVDGRRQRDVLRGRAETPHHISTCGTRCFLSDSVSGDIFELAETGGVTLFRAGEAEIGDSGFTYAQLEIFTTRREGDAVRVVGVCQAQDGKGSVVAGESGRVDALTAGPLRALMLWENGWRAACAACLALAALDVLFRLLLRSPRLAVRLAAGEILAAALLTGALTGVELSFFEDTVRSDAGQKLQMVGRNLVTALSAQEGVSAGRTAQAVAAVQAEAERILDGAGSYGVSVFWQSDRGPAVGCDPQAPAGVLAEDVKNRNYCHLVSAALAGEAGGEDGVREVKNANNTDLVHLTVFSQGERTGCVVVSQPSEALAAQRAAFLKELTAALILCPGLFLGLLLMTWRLLRPLGELRGALEEFYATGGGNTVALSKMPRTELYEVGRVFNELSVQTRVQFNKLSTINDAYVRLTPECLLRLLGKEDIQALGPGDFAAVDAGVLMLLPARPARTAETLERFLEPAARHVHALGGMLVDYDEGLGAVTALFPRPEEAWACARAYLEERGEEGGVTAAVFDERVEAGAFGSEGLMIPLAVSRGLHRKQEALERLGSFGAALIRAGEGEGGGALRLLGWDGALAYREDPACRPGRWQSRWPEAAPAWGRGMEAFRRGEFAPAMRAFAQVLRALPDDGAARWYLFRCAALRDGKESDPDLGLLYDWRDTRG